MKVYFVTGGAGFIGSALVRHLIKQSDIYVVNIDKLTYASNMAALEHASDSGRYSFSKTNICDTKKIKALLYQYQPDGIFHLAAESHVDRSIDNANDFIQTNLVGTFSLLEATRDYWQNLKNTKRNAFRFLHVSTDEVYGSLGDEGLFQETTAYDPRSPYSASKAGGDFLASAWYHTYDLPVLISNCSNNYGPYHLPEKLIPLMIVRALSGLSLPIYGDGQNIRDWLYVEDHVRALQLILEKGKLGQKYNIGGRNERTNLQIVETICAMLDARNSGSDTSYLDQIEYVTDRPGHDRRYAIDASKLENEPGWQAHESFETGLIKTVDWYCQNKSWWEPLKHVATMRQGSNV